MTECKTKFNVLETTVAMGDVSLGAGQFKRYGACISLDEHKTRLPLPELANSAFTGERAISP